MEEINFRKNVYLLCQQISKGKVTTYKEIGRALNVKCYRLIGQVLKKNPDPLNVPCFKVVKSDGSLGGYFGHDNNKKMKLLEKEGVEVKNNKINLEKYLYKLS